jgi:hypothetical protein
MPDRAPGAPPQQGTPGIHAKELVGIRLLNRRIGWQRLDLGPFFALYMALTVAVLVQGIRGNM